MNPYQSLTAQIMAAALLILQREDIHKKTANRDKFLDTYDYIVVGSGSAGTPVAYRLTEDPKTTVLLIEAGGRQSVVTDIPENYVMNLNTEFDWGYKNVRQSTNVGLAFSNQQIPQNRGKVLGGSSTLNAIINNRGNTRDYDNWAKTFGAKGWSFQEVNKYFKKFENNTDPEIVANKPGYHGTSGPVQISSWESPEPIIVYHQRALNQMGFKNVDINSDEQVGTCIMQTFQRKDGMRSSTANSYLDPNPHKNGLTAEGVEFIRNGKTYKVKANNEVVLSAGSINTPQLLMLSGIGPKDHLNELGIPVLADLPVGKYLKDHPSLSLNTLISDPLTVNTSPRLDVRQLHDFFNATGPLTEFFHSITYFNTKYNDDPNWPDVAFETIVLRFPDNLNVPVVNEFQDKEAWNRYYRPFLDKHYMYFQPILMRVKSYGKLRLTSKNPFDHPLIDPNYLADPQDYKALFEATKFVLRFLDKSPFSQYVSPHRPIPGCKPCKLKGLHNCDSYINCLIKQLTRTGYHPIGTTRMGAIERDDIVVDPRLRVKGVAHLRVCDSGIMPEMINSNTNSASIMIGEKCADLIKEDNGLSDSPPYHNDKPYDKPYDKPNEKPFDKPYGEPGSIPHEETKPVDKPELKPDIDVGPEYEISTDKPKPYGRGPSSDRALYKAFDEELKELYRERNNNYQKNLRNRYGKNYGNNDRSSHSY